MAKLSNLQQLDSADYLTFAGDEAGDASFSFTKGASSYFVLAFISTVYPDTLTQALTVLRQTRGLRANFEFKYHKLSSAALRKATFDILSNLDFSAWILIVNKKNLPDYWLSLTAHDFYAVIATELIVQIPIKQRENSILMLDEFDPKGKALLILKRSLKRRQIHRGFRKLINVRSTREPLVQIADLVAGAVLRSVTYGDSAMLNRIGNRIVSLQYFQPDHPIQKNPLS